MLGRSWWDLTFKLMSRDSGSSIGRGQNVTETISLYSNPTNEVLQVTCSSTGLWAPAQKEVTIKSNANVPVTVTVALADDLTGREKHEVARPVRQE
ncbi:hypothetical protein ACLK1S_18350 [Escherichia coli]